MKIALVYDRVNKRGGAERVLEALHQLWPEAPLFTAVFNPKRAAWAKVFPQVIPSFLQSFPGAKNHHEFYPALTPLAFESFNFSGFDVVISVTSAEAKAIITLPKTLHLCYCLTPTRYLWSHRHAYRKESGLGFWLGGIQKYLQRNDLVYAQRPDVYVAISETVQKRIKRYYHRDSTVIYPSVQSKKFMTDKPKTGKYYLLVSRLVAYKRVALAIKAFNRLGEPLVIVGSGRERQRLEQLAKANIRFAGWVNEDDLTSYYQNCHALIMPQQEDFGIVSVEAQAAGKPVISYSRGGAAETIIDGKSGILFKEASVDSLIDAVKQFKSTRWDRQLIADQAQKFDEEIFKHQFKEFVEAQWLKVSQQK
jgi:glycosyltransferase involved in cell wall biosynthesis